MAKTATTKATAEDRPAKGGKLKLIAIVLLVLLGGGGAAAWLGVFGGKADAAPEAATSPGAATAAEEGPPPARTPPVFVDMPEIMTNLNVTGRRPTFIRLRAKIEVATEADPPIVLAAMPRLQDLFQTYLREMKPEELRGSEGSYRLREELRTRAGIAASPARIRDVLFIEMIIQ